MITKKGKKGGNFRRTTKDDHQFGTSATSRHRGGEGRISPFKRKRRRFISKTQTTAGTKGEGGGRKLARRFWYEGKKKGGRYGTCDWAPATSLSANREGGGGDVVGPSLSSQLRRGEKSPGQPEERRNIGTDLREGERTLIGGHFALGFA